MLRVGDQLGPYTLVSKIGSGAFGTVWLADRSTLIATTRVALKVPSGDEVDMEAIKQEANTWVQASGHPNVVPIIEANIYDGQVVIASEYIAEGSLEDWLRKNGGKAPSVEAAVEMTMGILAGLDHLHTRHIIHRDLKPANLLLQGETPRLADFGISRILKNTSKSLLAAGTPSYMAPEAFDGKRNEQTDLWSVGVMLYQMLAGRLPFPQAEMTSLIGAIVSKNPDPLPVNVPAPLQSVINCALAKSPTQRYRTAKEMRSALRNALEAIRHGKTSPVVSSSQENIVRPTVRQPQPYTNPVNPIRPNPTAPRPAPMPVQPPIYPPSYGQMPRRGTSPVVWVLLVFLVAALIGGGVFAWLKLRPEGASATNGNIAKAGNNQANNNATQLRNANISSINVAKNIYKLEDAGLQFQVPDGWTKQEVDNQVALTAPDGTIDIRFMVVEEENLQAAINALGVGLSQAMTNVQTLSEMRQGEHNGMTVYSQNGNGQLGGITLNWGADIILANKPVIVLTIADPRYSGKHTAAVNKFMESVKRTG
ncbi:MAG TPA: protein kinase [Blastocatellia bacterium]|nr:protein kinase [Blastocatellia bacterium]